MEPNEDLRKLIAASASELRAGLGREPVGRVARFDEVALYDAIVDRWGPYGAHAEVFRRLVDELDRLRSERDAPEAADETDETDRSGVLATRQGRDRADTAVLEHSAVQLVGVHDPATCAGAHCTVHHRSDHHMRSWPQHWRSDRSMMERICPHGIGHPDPDEPDGVDTTHGCDGCCRDVRVG